MKTKYTAREYAKEMQKVHGSEAMVSWLTVGELLDLYDRIPEDSYIDDEVDQVADAKLGVKSGSPL